MFVYYCGILEFKFGYMFLHRTERLWRIRTHMRKVKIFPDQAVGVKGPMWASNPHCPYSHYVGCLLNKSVKRSSKTKHRIKFYTFSAKYLDTSVAKTNGAGEREAVSFKLAVRSWHKRTTEGRICNYFC